MRRCFTTSPRAAAATIPNSANPRRASSACASALPAADIDLVAWLVRWHLLMSVTAQTQDITDPDVVHRFAVDMADSERLDYLYLLTVADIAGTSAKLWNSWKRQAARGSVRQRALHAARRARAAAARRGARSRTREQARVKSCARAGIDDARSIASGRIFPSRVSCASLRTRSRGRRRHRPCTARRRAARADRRAGAARRHRGLRVRAPTAMACSPRSPRYSIACACRCSTRASSLAQRHEPGQLSRARRQNGTRARCAHASRACARCWGRRLQTVALSGEWSERASRGAASFHDCRRGSNSAKTCRRDARSSRSSAPTDRVCSPASRRRCARTPHRVHDARIATFGERVEDFF